MTLATELGMRLSYVAHPPDLMALHMMLACNTHYIMMCTQHFKGIKNIQFAVNPIIASHLSRPELMLVTTEESDSNLLTLPCSAGGGASCVLGP